MAMTATAGPPPSTNDPTSGIRERLAKESERLGLDSGIAYRVFPNASVDELTLLDALVARATRPADLGTPESLPIYEYRNVLERLGEEYVGALTGRGLFSAADVRPEQLREGVEALAEMARMVRAIPPARRAAMWPTLESEMKLAGSHYQILKRAIITTGIAAALDAEDHVVMTHLRPEVMPSLDLTILRMAGEADPERALQGLIRAARSAPRAVLATKTVAQLLEESASYIPAQVQDGAAQPAPAPAPGPATRSKRWTGLGKLFTGMATAGVNIAGGIALGVGGGPLAAGVTLGGVLGSCAAGIGAIAEGVGALRGE
jgi:hypothetical protein